MSVKLEQVIAYHESTKHCYNAFAPGPGQLDWATQPDPFRRYTGAEILSLDRFPFSDGPDYGSTLVEGRVEPAALGRESISRLFYDSLALSAWKQAGHSRWALRVNPSSGNLHPTEAYLVTGSVTGLLDNPAVCHYAPLIHGLEVRARFSSEIWNQLIMDFPPQTLLIGLTSIYWREAWKYGTRAFRYCQHDTGHAIAAIDFAAAAIGWKAVMLEDLGDDTIRDMLGLPCESGPEVEHAECVLALFPQPQGSRIQTHTLGVVPSIAQSGWHGTPNSLSPAHRFWSIIDEVDEATRKPDTTNLYGDILLTPDPIETIRDDDTVRLRKLIHQRRSAVDMDGRTGLMREGFFSILHRCLPCTHRFPFNVLPWPAKIHLLLFVHRVQHVPPGLYLLIRDLNKLDEQRMEFGQEFEWSRPTECPDDLPLYRLVTGDARRLAEQVCCHQAIAADGVFAAAMLAEFEQPLELYGPWFYRRLFWECGVIGQLLYLEAEAYGIQSTGIGCFFDDPVHEILGLKNRRYQSLYHFSMGGGVEDHRLTTLPPYPA